MIQPAPETPTHVLLVDDEHALLKLLTILLEEEGYRVTPAPDGRKALDLLRRARPDIVVTDYSMPEMTGSEMIDEIRADPELCDIPVLLMSSMSPLPVAVPADRFLEKGCGTEELLEAIRSLVAGRPAGKGRA